MENGEQKIPVNTGGAKVYSIDKIRDAKVSGQLESMRNSGAETSDLELRSLMDDLLEDNKPITVEKAGAWSVEESPKFNTAGVREAQMEGIQMRLRGLKMDLIEAEKEYLEAQRKNERDEIKVAEIKIGGIKRQIAEAEFAFNMTEKRLDELVN